MTSPLQLLRQCVQEGSLDQVRLDEAAKTLLFPGSVQHSRETPTEYASRAGEPFPLDAVWLRVKHADLQFRDYFQKCRELGITRIPLQQTQDLLAWLRGEQQDSQFLVSPQSIQPKEEESETPEDEAKAANPEQWSTAELAAREIDVNHMRWQLVSEVDFTPELQKYSGLVSAQAVRPSQLSGRRTGVDAALAPPSLSAMLSRKRKSEGQDASSSSSSSFSSSSSSSSKRAKHSVHRHIPIILVPDAGTALLNIYNCEEFLGGGSYFTAQEMKSRGVKKQKYVVITRASMVDTKKNVKFHVYDNPELLATEDWDRVVAVFADGPKWQFSNFPSPFDEPAQLFTHMCGFHLRYDDQPLHPNVSQWKVNMLSISRNHRYQDRGVVTQFWSDLGKWIRSRNHVRKLYI